ncbi:MAG: carboxypeptidase-like regulatory domain-containing protein [Bacteroidales bacterium]|nr:carboxypeptidase-like regulatory domain-containing protein [Bacteroidales bacterium]MCF8405414.1 carboxypeptidase-like regulatory domain-containing protein [Bacteroidales bacterium]
MLRNLLLTIGFILSTTLMVFSQSGSLKGKIFDKDTKEPIPFANIIVEVGGTQAGGATSDFDGQFIIKPIDPGTYTLKASYIGYKTVQLNGLVINSDQITFYNVDMESTTATLEEIVIESYKVPLIDKDKTVSGGSVTAEDIKKMPNRDANSVATSVGGVFSEDGERGNVRGARNDQTVMYIDGIRVIGTQSVPQSAIEQVSVYLGGLPAQYGDARGGIINVTTKGPSRTFGAGLELETSKFLDSFGHSRLGFNVQGPLIKGKKEAQTSLLGFFLSGDLGYREDSRPTAKGVFVAQDDYLNYLQQTPLRPSGLTGGGTFYNGEFTLREDLENQKATPNTSRYSVNLSGKIDVRTSDNTTLTFGGQYYYTDGNTFNFSHSMFNYDRNVLDMDNTWRVFGRFTQRFPTDKESTSLIKNVYYNIQADYSQVRSRTMDPHHKDDLFKYGYLGTFTTYKRPTYELGSIEIGGEEYNNVWIQNSWDSDTAYIFNPKSYNPYLANHTSQIYELFPDKGNLNAVNGNWRNEDDLRGRGGLLNGQQPDFIYGLWAQPGMIQSRYRESDDNQMSLNASAAADIGNHEVKFGFMYEQRSETGFSYNASRLWSRMRGLVNNQIQELDLDRPMIFEDTIKYDRLYAETLQFRFDRSLREKLGLPLDGLDFILVDSYDIDNNTILYYDKDGVMHTTKVDGDLYSIDMFSADELLENGQYTAYYYGYDYKGNKLTERPSIDDFFTEKDERGDYARKVAAFEPIYMAGFIQDKFAFEDLIFNIGVRVDRFDGNQAVLNDPYLFYEARTVKEVGDLEGQAISHPGNMGGDYVVYVDNSVNPTKVMGYRNEFTWFNAAGVEIQDPNTLDAGSGVSPYLVNPDQGNINSNAFKDYEPQWSIMPRISFSFPISDEALFFAHYDVLTQRPLGQVRSHIADYYFINTLGGTTINNPNLKPTKTIDYELGFQQKLSSKSSLKLVTFYREMRDDIQIYRFTGAYPRDYTSYNNIDFGTVKGLTVTYDLRRATSNTRLTASYTLQFADGTGSSSTTAQSLINSGLPNLRTTNPLNWDRRHNFNISLDYRFSDGKDYSGPTIVRHKGQDNEKALQLLKNTGVNFLVTGGSGTPYTAQGNITSFRTGGVQELKGTINGSRKPWQFRVDMRLDKEVYLNGGNSESSSYLNFYLQVLNIFNTQNILNVFSATGVPDDDGYLAAAEWQREISEQTNEASYRNLYALRIDQPWHYSTPRQIRLGVLFNF